MTFKLKNVSEFTYSLQFELLSEMEFGDLNCVANVFVGILQVLDKLNTEPEFKGDLLINLF